MLRLIGLPQIDGLAARPPDKAFVLLALLILDHPAGIPRGDAAALLWSEATQQKAFANLRQLLAIIAKCQALVGHVYLEWDNRTVWLSRLAHESDLRQFQEALPPTDNAGVTKLMTLASGRLLWGVDLKEPDLAGWLEERRRDLHERLKDLILQAANTNFLPELDRAFGHLCHADPSDERLLRRRMTNLTGLGRNKEAMRVFERSVAFIRDELGAEPELETTVLAAKIGRAPSTIITEISGVARGLEKTGSVPKVALLPPDGAHWVNAEELQLARSLASDITLQLCRRREFAMLAPYTARQLAGQDAILAVAPFDADYAISTSIFPGASFSRLAFTLIDLKTRAILHADEVPLEPSRLLSSQHLIAHRFATAIAGHIAILEERRFLATGSASAYVQLLLASPMVQNSSLSLLRKARKHLSQALRLSPDYVPALATQARTLTIEWLLLGRSEKELLHQAQNLAARAAELDPLNPSGHRELGHASLYLGALDESEERFAMAVERAPHHADLLIDQADVLVHSSRSREAKPLVDKAFLLNPLAPDDYRWVGGSVEFFLENYGAALSLLLGMRDRAMVDRLIAATAAMAGDAETAETHRKRWMERYPDFRIRNFETFMPHRSKRDIEHFKSALALAGFE